MTDLTNLTNDQLSGTNGHHCRLFSSGAGDKRSSLVFRSEIHETQESAYAAAAEWVRRQE